MDVVDPYERRGVPHPHAHDAESDPLILSGDGGAVQIEVPPLDSKEKAALRQKLRDRDAKRIRPGFYVGSEPLDSD